MSSDQWTEADKKKAEEEYNKYVESKKRNQKSFIT